MTSVVQVSSPLRKEDIQMTKFVSRFVKDESGATAIEYGLIAALIAVVIIAAVTALGTTISEKFTEVVEGMGGSV
jgi:pilus assembly protein Flp/PilA